MKKQSALNLVWIDLEMTGLDPELEVIIEIATLVTDYDLNVLAEGPCLAIHQSDEILGRMDAWNQKHHNASWHDLTPLYSTQISHWNLLPDHIMVKDRYPMNIRNEKVMILPLLMVFFPELKALLGWLNH